MAADACAPAYLAEAPLAVTLAYLPPATLLALALLAIVVADAGAPTDLAATLLAVVGNFLAGGLGMSCARLWFVFSR